MVGYLLSKWIYVAYILVGAFFATEAIAQQKFFVTPSRGGAAGAKQVAQIRDLYTEDEALRNENASQEVSITTNATNIAAVSATTNDMSVCGNTGKIYGNSHTNADAQGCVQGFEVTADGGVKVGFPVTCDTTAEGTLRYNQPEKVFEFCDGSAWQGLAAAGGGCDYNFTEVTGAPISTYYASNQPSFSGFSGAQVATLSGDPTATIVKNGSNTGQQSVTVQNFDNVGIRVKSSDNYSRAVNTSLKIGGSYSACWAVTTKDQDATPNAFDFLDTYSIRGEFVTSNQVTLTGFDAPLEVSISGQGNPQFQVNGGSWVSTANISPGDSIQLRLSASSLDGESYPVTFSAGTTSDTWTVSTYTYAYTSWSCGGCSASCGGGSKSCTRSCKTVEDGTSMDCSYCGAEACSKTESCNTSACRSCSAWSSNPGHPKDCRMQSASHGVTASGACSMRGTCSYTCFNGSWTNGNNNCRDQ